MSPGLVVAQTSSLHGKQAGSPRYSAGRPFRKVAGASCSRDGVLRGLSPYAPLLPRERLPRQPAPAELRQQRQPPLSRQMPPSDPITPRTVLHQLRSYHSSHRSTLSRRTSRNYEVPGTTLTAIRAFVNQLGGFAVVPPRSNRAAKPAFDQHLYRERHRIENLFARLKAFRRIATRYDKLLSSFASMFSIACILVWLKA